MGESKTAQDRISRYAGGFDLHFSHFSPRRVGIPQDWQKSILITGVRD
jgi:hypothetical protein